MTRELLVLYLRRGKRRAAAMDIAKVFNLLAFYEH